MRSIIGIGALGSALFALAGCQLDPQPVTSSDCATKSCGDPCRLCDPNDPYCAETADQKYCQADGSCGPSAPVCGGESPCSVALCPANTYCVVLESFPPQAHCVPIDACATVRCAQGFECLAGQCVPAQAPVTCGGIAGTRCPGQGSCVDDPRDACTPHAGGADCGGICLCPGAANCPAGTHWDGSPAACACVPDVLTGTRCGSNTCGAGEFCCNASCGTCAPRGGSCTQQVCAPKK